MVGAGVVALLVLTGAVFRVKHMRWRRRFT
jgi:hypothetical protein